MKKEIRKLLRYMILFTALFVATQFIHECELRQTTAFMLSAIGAIVFAMIDIHFPLLTE